MVSVNTGPEGRIRCGFVYYGTDKYKCYLYYFTTLMVPWLYHTSTTIVSSLAYSLHSGVYATMTLWICEFTSKCPFHYCLCWALTLRFTPEWETNRGCPCPPYALGLGIQNIAVWKVVRLILFVKDPAVPLLLAGYVGLFSRHFYALLYSRQQDYLF